MIVKELYDQLNALKWNAPVEFDIYIYLGGTKITKSITGVTMLDGVAKLEWEDKE